MNDSNVIPMCRNHFMRNDHGGVTYSSRQAIGPEPSGRTETLADVRVLVDAMMDLIAAHRAFWPEPFPIPEDVHCALLGADYALARVRGGTLKQLAEKAET
ncbi:MAG: hypothetical protein IE917_10735 [Betaproteobacteria bacterium]|nr:hypothetical protein [Betaproteobacteria bacterium]